MTETIWRAARRALAPKAVHDLMKAENSPFVHALLTGDAGDVIGASKRAILFEHSLPAGWLRFACRVESETGGATARLIFDLGDGFNERHSLLLAHARAGPQVAHVYVPKPIRRIRFEPLDCGERFSIRELTAQPLGRLRTAHMLTRKLLHYAFRHPRAVWPVARGRLQALASGRMLFLHTGRGPDFAWPRSGPSYSEWVERWDTLRLDHVRAMEAQLSTMPQRPRFSILMPVSDVPVAYLDEAIASVVTQIYPDWKLFIAVDPSTRLRLREVLDAWVARDRRIRIAAGTEPTGIAAANNRALALATSEFVALMGPGDVLRPHSLFCIAALLNESPDVDVIYTDEDKIDERPAIAPCITKYDDLPEPPRRRFDPKFKCDWNPDLFLSHNYLNRLTVLRAALVREAGGFRTGFEGSQDYELFLRVTERLQPCRIRHVPLVLYHERSGSAARNDPDRNATLETGKRALEDHFRRMNNSVALEPLPGPLYRRRYRLPDHAPLVSLLIPTKDHAAILSRCIDSILRKTTYPNYEIVLVDNASTAQETISYFRSIERDPRIRLLSYPHAFNFSAINNYAASNAGGSVLGLINNDVVVITPGWLEEMVSHALRPDIGAVGAMLYYRNDTIQHAGVITGIGGVAGHSHKHFPRGDGGYCSRLRVVQNVSAVTGACLVLRRAIFDEVGGLDADRLHIAYNDVDLCLKIRQAGYRNVWTPFAELYHLESSSRGHDATNENIQRFKQEMDFMRSRWGPILHHDPAYSPNLTLEKEDFSLAAQPRFKGLDDSPNSPLSPLQDTEGYGHP